MPIQLGDRNETVRLWRVVMNARFGGLYTRLHGPLPTDTDEYGPRAASWQREYEFRTGQVQDGVVSDHDLAALKIVAQPPISKPWLFTVHGTGMPDPLGPGLPADTARAVLDLYAWQPIGNYPAEPFPMWPSILKGIAELVLQIKSKPGKFALAGYSQGAVVVAYVLKHYIMDPAGELHNRLSDITKVVFWGNPMRQKGIAHFDEWIYPIAPPDSHGIMEDRLEGLDTAPFEIRDYAHALDMYACNKDNDTDEYKRAICKIVMGDKVLSGNDSIIAQIAELGQRPLVEGVAMFTAMINALTFFTGNAHGYNIYPAINFLRST